VPIIVKLAGGSVVNQRCWATRMRVVVSAPTRFTNSCRVGPDSSVACVDRTRTVVAL
jgi:hypothetical protein